MILSDDGYPLEEVIRERFCAIEEIGTITVTRFGLRLKTYALHVGRDHRPPPPG